MRVRVCAPHGKLRQPVSDASDGVHRASAHPHRFARFFDHHGSHAPASTDFSRVTESGSLVGRFLQSRRRISRNPAPALSFRPWPFSCGRVQTCKPGTHQGSHLLRCRHPAQARNDWAFGPLAHTARCEPQTLQTLFSGRTLAKCCACAPRNGISPGRTPFARGMYAFLGHNNRR